MFGKNKPPQADVEARLPAADAARIEGGGLVQVIVTSLGPVEFFLFLNDQLVPQVDVESLSLSVEAPGADVSGGIVRATLARYVTNVTGTRTIQRSELFPCTLEIVAAGRRVAVTCATPNSLEGVWINLGLRADGTSADVKGAQSVQVLVTDSLVDARITWVGGETEDLLPL